MRQIVFACVLAGCGGQAPMQVVNPLEIKFDTATYTVQPGEEKRYYCFTTRLPADKDAFLTQIAPIYGKATHHLGVYYTLADEPDGVFDCPQLVRQTWVPLYGGGVMSGIVSVPDGAAFHLKAGQQILVQLHLLNATTSAVTDKATIKFLTTANTSATPAGIFGMSNVSGVNLMPNAPGEAVMDCPVGESMNVFAVFGHMHQLGTHIELSRTVGGSVLFGEDWTFNDQPTVPMKFALTQGDSLHLHCQYNNTTNTQVTYGESTFNEMCAFVLYYTPYQHLDGCQK